MDIVLYSLIQYLRSGAFGLSARVHPLSPFKWERLIRLATTHDVTDILYQGLHKQQGNPLLNIQLEQLADVAEEASRQRETLFDQYSLEDASLPGKKTTEKLDQICKTCHSESDITRETALIFGILTHNTEKMLNQGFGLRGIVDLGLSLRSIGDKVDYVLLERWLEQTGTRKMAQLQANILIDLFDFESEELPFMEKKGNKGGVLAIKCITQIEDLRNTGDIKSDGYVKNNKNRFSTGFRRMCIYFPYAPSKSLRSMTNSMKDGLSQIEE